MLVIDRSGRVLSANRSAQALFGHGAESFAALTFGDLFAPESRRAALDYLDRLARENTLIDEGRELIGQTMRCACCSTRWSCSRSARGLR